MVESEFSSSDATARAYRRIAAMFELATWLMNVKRVERIGWQVELKVPLW